MYEIFHIGLNSCWRMGNIHCCFNEFYINDSFAWWWQFCSKTGCEK